MRLMYDTSMRVVQGLAANSTLPIPTKIKDGGWRMYCMSLIEPILLGISLAMDALAVSMALGAAERKNFNWSKILMTAFAFGAFQAGMPLIGWGGGALLGSLVQTFGRCLAAGLLMMIGGKMIYEARRPEREEPVAAFSFRRLIGLSFATSIDALLVGVGYACLNRSGILLDVSLIGAVTFLIAGAGCLAGRCCGRRYGRGSEVFGGIVLIGIGVKVLFFG